MLTDFACHLLFVSGSRQPLYSLICYVKAGCARFDSRSSERYSPGKTSDQPLRRESKAGLTSPKRAPRAAWCPANISKVFPAIR